MPRLKTALVANLARITYGLVNGCLRLCAFALWPRARPKDAARVCVFRIGNLGDITCALPAIRRIRAAYPDAHLTLLSSPGARGMTSAADVLEGAEWVDELVLYHTDEIDTFAKRRAMLLRLRARQFDAWVDLPNNLTSFSRQLRDMAFARLAGAKWARGWQIDTLTWGRQAQSDHFLFRGEVDRCLQIVSQAGVPGCDVDFGLPRTREAVTRVDTILRFRGLHSRRLVVIAPGARRTTNRWEADRFAQVGRSLLKEGCAIVLLGDRSESEVCRSIAATIGSDAHSFAGDLSVAEAGEMLRRCELAVCVDSGVQHLAAAVHTTCVSLFSFRDMRGKWRPHGHHNVVLQKRVECHTCLLESCPHDNLCMKAITVEEVTRAASSLLHRRAALPYGPRPAPARVPRRRPKTKPAGV